MGNMVPAITPGALAATHYPEGCTGCLPKQFTTFPLYNFKNVVHSDDIPLYFPGTFSYSDTWNSVLHDQPKHVLLFFR
jgi:hypothetical protein